MRAAVTTWDGRVSPVFDVSREALVLTIEEGVVCARHTESIETTTAMHKINRLLELGVETLICGAISDSLQWELDARGIVVFAFVAGDLEEVVESLVAGALPAAALSMPGCCGRRNRFRGGRGGQGERGSGACRKGRS